MATALTKNPVGSAGLALTFPAADATGNTAPTGSGVFLLVKNGGGSSINVLLAYPSKYDGDQTVSNRSIAVAAGAETVIPLRDIYKDPSTGVASITYSATPTSVTVCVVAVP